MTASHALRDRCALTTLTAFATLICITPAFAGADKQGGGGGGGGGEPVSEWGLVAIDRDADTLVRINPSTGEYTTIGSLGTNVNDIDLAWHDGQLYAASNWAGSHVDLLKIDINTGGVLSSTTITRDGLNVLSAEGLTSADGQLMLGYTSNNQISSSNAIGMLGLDGTVTNQVNLGSGADLDALGFNPLTGRPMSADTRIGAAIDFYDIVTDTNTAYDLFASTPTGAELESIADIAFNDGIIHGIDAGLGILNTFDAQDGSFLSSVNIVGDTDLHGLAWVEFASVPSPGALALLGLAGLRGRRRRG